MQGDDTVLQVDPSRYSFQHHPVLNVGHILISLMCVLNQADVKQASNICPLNSAPLLVCNKVRFFLMGAWTPICSKTSSQEHSLLPAHASTTALLRAF